MQLSRSHQNRGFKNIVPTIVIICIPMKCIFRVMEYLVPGTRYQYSCLLRLLLPNVYVHIRIAFQQNDIYTVYICPVCPINHFENDPGIM